MSSKNYALVQQVLEPVVLESMAVSLRSSMTDDEVVVVAAAAAMKVGQLG